MAPAPSMERVLVIPLGLRMALKLGQQLATRQEQAQAPLAILPELPLAYTGILNFARLSFSLGSHLL